MQKNRIPAAQIGQFTSWELPEVKDGQIVAVEKLRQRNSRGELVDVDKDEVIYSSMTAGQLEEISQQAYEEVREQASAEGFAAGREQGYQEGLQQAQAEIHRQVQALQQTLSQLIAQLNQQDDDIEQALVNTVICIAKAVIQRELQQGNSEIGKIVQQAVAMLPFTPERITVFLSEQDHGLLTANQELPEGWQIQKDPSLKPGGCRVVSRDSVVDYTLEEQFQQVINTLVADRYAELAASGKDQPDSRDD